MRDVRDWWLEKARGLPVGQSSKLHHLYDPPYKSKSVLVYNTELGYGAKCFRRGTSDWVFKERISLDKLAQEAIESASSDMPDDMMPFYPTVNNRETQISNWYLLKRGVDPYIVQQHGAFISKSRMRLLYKCKDIDGTVGYLGRDITERNNAKVVTYMHKGKRLKHAVYGSGSVTVLVEDVNSAIKVYEAVKRANLPVEVVSLNGTSGSDKLSLHLLDHTVIIWLDGDSAGQRGALKLYKDLTPLANSVKVVHSERDPKEFGYEEIGELLVAILNDDQGIKSWDINNFL